MKIALVEPPWAEVYGSYKSAAKIGNCFPPLGLIYIASVLEKNNHSVKIIDSEIEELDLDGTVNEIRKFKADIVGITATTPIFHVAKKLAKKIKNELKLPVIIGGPHITVMPEETMKEEIFDYGVYGEGEETFLELVNSLENKKRLDDIMGIIFRKNGKIVINKPRPFNQKLDDLPIPNRKLLKIDKYLWSVPEKGIVKFTTIMGSRGCPFDCIFCSQRTMFGTKIRFRSIKNIIEEIEYITNNLVIKHFQFIDDTLTLNKERLKEMCNLILQKKLDITWEGWTRANTVDEETLRLMKRAGFVRVSFGIESGNPHILKVIKKGVELDDITRAYKLAKKVGLETRGSVIIGNPDETKKTLWDTLKFIRKLKYCDQIYLNIATPYPGTKLYDYAINNEKGMRLLTRDFSEYRRYGDAVVEVNDLSSKDLSRYQKIGFLMFYLTPGRIYYNLKRAGFKAGFKNALAFVRSVF